MPKFLELWLRELSEEQADELIDYLDLARPGRVTDSMHDAVCESHSALYRTDPGWD